MTLLPITKEIEMTRRDTNKHRSQLWAPGLSPGRIEALTDGTFAIAMTILVLELPAPLLFEAASHGEQPTSFLAMWPEFYIYAMGFIALGVYWTLHHYMFHYIKRSDGVLMWLNILFLIFAALVPFSAKVLSVNEVLFTNGESEMNAASGFFIITTSASILILLAMWRYATQGYRLVDPDIDKSIISAISRVILIGVFIYLLGFIVSSFFPWAGYTAFVAIAYMIAITARGKLLFISESSN
jgi:uncharacterized membrane protein